MFLSIQQKFILDTLKKLNCVRRRQLHTLVRGGLSPGEFQHHVDGLQTAGVRLGGGQPDQFPVHPHIGGTLDAAPAGLLERGRAERIIWIADSGEPPKGLTLPPKHFFAARQFLRAHRRNDLRHRFGRFAFRATIRREPGGFLRRSGRRGTPSTPPSAATAPCPARSSARIPTP